MAKKITQEQVQQMIELYSQLKTYSAVAKQMNVSPSTVSRYIKEANNIQTYTERIEPSPNQNISRESVFSFSFLTQEEKESYNTWIKEFN